MRGASEASPVVHVRGQASTCLIDCVNMVLHYYGFEYRPLGFWATGLPANLMAVDSIINHAEWQGDDGRVHSFVLRQHESFVMDQLARGRPLILILKGRKGYHHSVVVSELSSNGRALRVHDPVRKQEIWTSRRKLMARWQRAGGIVMLIGLVEHGQRTEGLRETGMRLAVSGS